VAGQTSTPEIAMPSLIASYALGRVVARARSVVVPMLAVAPVLALIALQPGNPVDASQICLTGVGRRAV
jgi:hypothetical protein